MLTVVQVEDADVLYCRLYDVALLTALQLSVADVVVIAEEDNEAGVPQATGVGGMQPNDEPSDARAPPELSTAAMRCAWPLVNIYMQASSV